MSREKNTVRKLLRVQNHFQKERGMKLVNMSFKELNAELTREELEELKNAAASTIKYDEDSPEMTEEMLK